MDYSKFKVLIVDDNTTNIQVVGSILKNLKVDISVATNGRAALEIVNKVNPDLILLDIMMPEMDGFEVIDELYSNDSTRQIPVIFITAKIQTEDIVKAFEKGAVDYITKPFKAPELLVRVKTQLNIKHYLLTLERQTSQLKKLNQDKNEFLSIAAHDLKNPINTITMLGKVLRDTDDLSADEIKEFANDLITSSSKMFHLISELLDINAIEEGKIAMTKENVNLDSVIKTTVMQYDMHAKEKNIKIVYNNTAQNPYALADENAVVQILDNILSNAIKYSPFDKSIYIELLNTDNTIIFSIKDEGLGFTEEDKTKLFSKFSKLSTRPTNNENSTGLGLSIVKRYIEALDGNIDLESTHGEGAKFIVSLPISSMIDD